MLLSDAFRSLGEDRFAKLLRTISFGKLKTFQLYERFKLRTHIEKLNTESLRKASPRLWERLLTKDEEYATDLSQAVLVSHMELIVQVLNYLKIPNEDGFFIKDLDATPYLIDNWQQRVYDEFKTRYPEQLVAFYINHLIFELVKEGQPFQAQAA